MPRTRQTAHMAKDRPPKSTEKATSQKGGGGSANVAKKSKRKHKRSYRSFRTFIYKLHHQLHPDMGMGSQAAQVLDGMFFDLFDILVTQAAQLTAASNRKTLSSGDVLSAVRLVFPGELASNAVVEARKSLRRYEQSEGRPVPPAPPPIAPAPAAPKQ